MTIVKREQSAADATYEPPCLHTTTLCQAPADTAPGRPYHRPSVWPHGSFLIFPSAAAAVVPLADHDFRLQLFRAGAMVSLFFIVSGTGQMLSGFLVVDRSAHARFCLPRWHVFVVAGVIWHGPNSMLLASLFCSRADDALPNPGGLPPSWNKRVAATAHRAAFSMHGLSGNLGWAPAPFSWPVSPPATGSGGASPALRSPACAAVVLAIMLLRDGWMTAILPPVELPKPAAAALPAPPGNTPWPFEAALGVAVLFFFWSTCASVPSRVLPVCPVIHGRFAVSLVTALIVTIIRGWLSPAWSAALVVICAAAGEGDLHLHAGLGPVAVCRRNGLAAGMAAVVVASVAGSRIPACGLARHADQARSAPGASQPRLRQWYSGLIWLLPGGAGLRIHAGPPDDQRSSSTARQLRLYLVVSAVTSATSKKTKSHLAAA